VKAEGNGRASEGKASFFFFLFLLVALSSLLALTFFFLHFKALQSPRVNSSHVAPEV
jgi:hypothetical protein